MATAADLPPSLESSGQLPELSREDILKQIFGDIGKLFEDFSCAVESTVLLHGRMYITNKFICFYSNLFGLEKKIRIPYSHIKSITKENTAMVIPNAIAISTDKRDYVFRSFWDRDECYKMLISHLDTYKDGRHRSSTFSDVPAAIRAATAPAVAAVAPTPIIAAAPVGSHASTPITVTATVIAPSPESLQPPTPATIISSSTSSSAAPLVSPSTAASAPASAPIISPSTAAAEGAASLPEGATNVPFDPSRRASRKMSLSNLPEDGFEDSESGFIRDPSRPASVALTTDAALTFTQELAKAKLKIQVVNDFIDISLKDFEMLFIGEGAPYSFKRYHESVKDTNVVLSPWGEPAPGLGVGREMKFFKPVNLPGLASTRGMKVQRLRRFGAHGVILYSITKLEDVPAADAFSVDDVIAVSVVSENRIALDISFQVTFTKGTMMRYIIERSTNAEMTKWLDVFFQHLKKTSDLFSAGKLDIAAAPEASSAKETVPASPRLPEPTKEAVEIAAAPAPTPSLASSVLQSLLAFNDHTLGDRIKTLFALLCIVFLVMNALIWHRTAQKIDQLESALDSMSKALQSIQAAHDMRA